MVATSTGSSQMKSILISLLVGVVGFGGNTVGENFSRLTTTENRETGENSVQNGESSSEQLLHFLSS